MATGGSQRGSISTKLGTDDLFIVYESLLEVRDKYKFIGLGIGVKKSIIDSIVKSQGGNVEDCLLEILSVRLKQTPALTWPNIIKVLKSKAIDEPLVAEDIEKNLESSLEKNKKEEGKESGGKEYTPMGCTQESEKPTHDEVSNDNDTIQQHSDSSSISVKRESESACEQPHIVKAVTSTSRGVGESFVAQNIDQSISNESSLERKNQYEEGRREVVPSKEEHISIGCNKESNISSDEDISNNNDSLQPHSPSISKTKSKKESDSASASRVTILHEQYKDEATSKELIAMKHQQSSGQTNFGGTKEQSYNEPVASDDEVKVELRQKKRDKAAMCNVNEVDEDVPGDDEESDHNVRDQVAKKQIRRRQRDSPAMKGDSSPSSSQDDNQDTNEERKESGGYSRVRRERKTKEEEKNACSSLDTDDSSPESEIYRTLKLQEKRQLKLAFKRQFGRLCVTIKDPVEAASLLQAEGLLSSSTMKDIIISPESNQEKKIRLVEDLQKKLKLRPDKIFTVIKVFLHNDILQGLGNELWIQAGKICPDITANMFGSEKSSTEQSPVGPTSGNVAANNPESLPPPQPVSSIGTISSVPSHIQVSQSMTQSGLSPVLAEYAKYLKACYRARPLAAADKYLPTLSSPYINLAMVSRKDSGPEEKDEFTRQTLHGGIDQIVRYKTPIAMEDLLSPEKTGGGPIRFVLVEGPPGIGKSTCVWELCRRWDEILGAYVIVLLLKLREKYVLNATSLSDLFRYPFQPELSKDIARALHDCHGQKLLLVLDGFDEVSHSVHEDSVIRSILSRQLLPECTIILTTRPVARNTLESVFQPRVDKHVEIIGFTEEERVRYIIEVFNNEPELQANFLKYMFLIPHIMSMMYIPLNCAIITQVYYESQKSCHLSIPKTRTQLYVALTHSLLVRHMKMKDKEQVYTCMLPEGLGRKDMEDFKCLAKFAFDSYHSVEKKVTFFDEDIPDGLVHFGFMNESSEMYAGKGVEKTLSFLHLSLQEYLAAWHLANSYSTKFQVAYSTLPFMYPSEVKYNGYEKEEEDLIDAIKSPYLKSNQNSPLEHLLEPVMFLAGITGWKYEGSDNPWEVFLSKTQLSHWDMGKRVCFLYEAQNPGLISQFFTACRIEYVDINPKYLSLYGSYALSYCLAHSSLSHCSLSISLDVSYGGKEEEDYEMLSLVETFVKGHNDHCGSNTPNIKNLLITQRTNRMEIINKCFTWLTKAQFISSLEAVFISSFHINEALICALLKAIENLKSLTIIAIESSLDVNPILEPLRSLKEFMIVTKRECSFPSAAIICNLIECSLTKVGLNMKLPSTPHDLHSPTDALLHSMMKSVLRSNQITQLILPNISQETMAGVHRILLHCPNLVQLKLVRTRLGYDGILFICSALMKNTTLQEIIITEDINNGESLQYSSKNVVPSSDKTTYVADFLLKLNNILKKNSTLKEMDIQSLPQGKELEKQNSFSAVSTSETDIQVSFSTFDPRLKKCLERPGYTNSNELDTFYVESSHLGLPLCCIL